MTMNKTIWIGAALLVALAQVAYAQVPARLGGTGCRNPVTKATLPANGAGKICVITDGLTGTDCTTGGGGNLVLCYNNGSSWSALSASGSGTDNLTWTIDKDGSGTEPANGAGLKVEGGSGTDITVLYDATDNQLDFAGAASGYTFDKEVVVGGCTAASNDCQLKLTDNTASCAAAAAGQTNVCSIGGEVYKKDSADAAQVQILDADDKTGADASVVSGTAGTNGNLSKWNVDGDLVDGPGLTGADANAVTGTAGASTQVGAWNVDGDLVGATATDDTVLVGDGSGHATKAIPDCTDTGGNHLNYTASTNALSCGTSGSGGGTYDINQFYPFGYTQGQTASHGGTGKCRCSRFSLPQRMDGISHLGYSTKTADGTDTQEIAVFSLDGNTRYFKGTLDVSSTGAKALLANADSQAVMTPGDYYLCYSYDTAGGAIYGAGASSSPSILAIDSFTVTCTGGTMPATITPSVTWNDPGTVRPPTVALIDED